MRVFSLIWLKLCDLLDGLDLVALRGDGDPEDPVVVSVLQEAPELFVLPRKTDFLKWCKKI